MEKDDELVTTRIYVRRLMDEAQGMKLSITGRG